MGIKPKAIYKRFERMQNMTKNGDNVDTTVDNVKVLASIGIALVSFGKGTLTAIVLIGLAWVIYWLYKRWRQNVDTSCSANRIAKS